MQKIHNPKSRPEQPRTCATCSHMIGRTIAAIAFFAFLIAVAMYAT